MTGSKPVLVLGAGGQVGSALQIRGRRRGVNLVSLSRQQADLRDLARLRAVFEEVGPGAIINAAAFTSVDRAQVERREAYAVNAFGAEKVAILARDWGIPLLHISTDYVFDGAKKSAYLETDPTGPLGEYGASKLEGERLVLAAHAKTLVMRTSGVYGLNGHNFVRSILSNIEAGRALTVVDDQVGCPTFDVDLADALLTIASELADGSAMPRNRVMNLCGANAASRFEFACRIAQLARCYLGFQPTVNPCKTIAGAGQAERPANSALCTRFARATFGVQIPGWQDALPRMIKACFKNGMLSSAKTRQLHEVDK